jgi:UV radiation resistance-associated gene protein
LKTYQFKLAEETVICESLRQEILRVGSFSPSGSLESSSGDKFHAQQLRKSCENLRHKIKILREEKSRKEISINVLKRSSEKFAQETENRSAQLQKLKRHLEENIALADSRIILSETRDAVTQTWSQLVQRRQELISQLKYIYPIAIVRNQLKGETFLLNKFFQDPQGLAKICGVPLISSEELNSQDEASSSVALGFAAHATMMVAFFLDVPLRYPTRPEGSRAKIWDMVAAKLPDTERE